MPRHTHTWSPLTPAPADLGAAFFYLLRHQDETVGCQCGAVGCKSRGRRKGGGPAKVHVIRDQGVAARIRAESRPADAEQATTDIPQRGREA